MSKEWPEITKDTPLSEVQEIHKRIWEYAVKHGHKPQDSPYPFECALCAYSDCIVGLIDPHSVANELNYSCRFCPARWPMPKEEYMDDCCSPCAQSIFGEWLEAAFRRDGDEMRVLAKQIRDIPFYTKEEYDEILLEESYEVAEIEKLCGL